MNTLSWRRLLPIALIAMLLALMPAAAFADVEAEDWEPSAMTAQSLTAGTAPAFTMQTTPMKVATSKGKVVSNGTYYISSAQNTLQNVTHSKTNVLLANATTAKAQRWKLNFDYDVQAYYITNAKSGKALTAKGKAANGANVYEAKLSKKNKNQQWKVTSTATGFTFVPAANSKVALTIDANGNAIVASSSKQGVKKFWLFGSAGSSVMKSGTYTISNSNGLLLTVPNRSIGKNKRLKVNTNENNLGQVFEFQYVSGGYFKITNMNSGFALTASGSKVVQKKYTKSKKQLWMPMLQPTGEVKFLNKGTKKLLDIAGAKAAVANGSDKVTQNWKISPAASGLSAVAKRALYKANTRKSKSKYNLVADLTAHEFFVFQKAYKKGKKGPWVLKDSWRISSGRNKCTRPLDSTITSHSYRLYDFYCFYASGIGGGSWIHSLIYTNNYAPTKISDGRLGMNISHGCIRMAINHAKWVYKNCPIGTAMSRYY